MTVREIIKWPDERLRQVSEPVPEARFGTLEFSQLVADLVDTMRAHKGLGLSAIQIGIPLRLFVMESLLVFERDFAPARRGPAPDFVVATTSVTTSNALAVCNPTIVNSRGVVLLEEGCLSFPDVFVKRSRVTEIDLVFRTERGARCSHIFDAWVHEVQTIQHEIEHLDGKLLVDELGAVDRVAARQLKKLERKSLTASRA